MRLKWVHISDLHFHFNNIESRKLREDLIKRIKTFSEIEKIDYIFCTGDIFDKNFETTEEIIKYLVKIMKAAKIPKEKLIIIPGNHDRDRESIKEIICDIYNSEDIDNKIRNLPECQYSELINSFSNFFEFYESLMGKSYYQNFLNPHYILKDPTLNINILKINTAWLERNSEDIRMLRIGEEKLFEVLEKEKISKDSLNIALGHHPLNNLYENGERNLKEILKRNGIELYFCGHVHYPFVDYDGVNNILQIGCTAGINDDHTSGGYILGTVNSDIDCYKIEYYRWEKDHWYTDIGISGTNEHGIFYFDTQKCKHCEANKIAVIFKVYGNKITIDMIRKTLENNKVELIQYPYSNIDLDNLDWEEQKLSTVDLAKQIIAQEEKEIYIFPLAPIPLLITFGYKLQRNFGYKILQYDRYNDKWVYNEDKQETPKILIDYKKNNSKVLVLKISISIDIRAEEIKEVLGQENYDILSFDKEGEKSIGEPLYSKNIEDIAKFISKNIFSKIKNYNEIHIFAGVSAALAIEIGRFIQQGVFPQVHLYNFYHGKYTYCYKINE